MKPHTGSNANFRGLVFPIGESDHNVLMKEDCDLQRITVYFFVIHRLETTSQEGICLVLYMKTLY